eukprot:comp21573_c0_seq1/m.47340 comp21573_c0_seq1/g.47340  ORF comp21573_c0_seq1/g.47340 comp21573_c0_seq1/m.47340 type:complete len:375 (+) comp21573_c0_seq1:655-1779(+)
MWREIQGAGADSSPQYAGTSTGSMVMTSLALSNLTDFLFPGVSGLVGVAAVLRGAADDDEDEVAGGGETAERLSPSSGRSTVCGDSNAAGGWIEVSEGFSSTMSERSLLSSMSGFGIGLPPGASCAGGCAAEADASGGEEMPSGPVFEGGEDGADFILGAVFMGLPIGEAVFGLEPSAETRARRSETAEFATMRDVAARVVAATGCGNEICARSGMRSFAVIAREPADCVTELSVSERFVMLVSPGLYVISLSASRGTDGLRFCLGSSTAGDCGIAGASVAALAVGAADADEVVVGDEDDIPAGLRGDRGDAFEMLVWWTGSTFGGLPNFVLAGRTTEMVLCDLRGDCCCCCCLTGLMRSRGELSGDEMTGREE